MANNDLLTPSLTEATRTPIFSINAMIAAAFFGGAFAVPLLAMENSRRLGRLRTDSPLLVLGLLVAAAAVLFTLESAGSLDTSEARSEVRLVSRVMGFAYVGAYYWLHRQAHRTLRTLGIDPASPYVAVVAAVLLSFAVTLGLYKTAVSGVLEVLS